MRGVFYPVHDKQDASAGGLGVGNWYTLQGLCECVKPSSGLIAGLYRLTCNPALQVRAAERRKKQRQKERKDKGGKQDARSATDSEDSGDEVTYAEATKQMVRSSQCLEQLHLA
jgi:hypothetical protein